MFVGCWNDVELDPKRVCWKKSNNAMVLKSIIQAVTKAFVNGGAQLNLHQQAKITILRTD